MKKQWWLAALALVASASAFADPGVMIGVNYNFDGQLGITLKVLTTDKQDRPALGVGVSYLPMRKSFGFDADVDQANIAAHCGSFPIRLAGTGVIGAITVSGAPGRDDHGFVVTAIARHLGIDAAPLMLAAQ